MFHLNFLFFLLSFIKKNNRTTEDLFKIKVSLIKLKKKIVIIKYTL